MSNPKYEHIAEYLSGNLKGDELKAFEKKLKENADFAEEVRLYAEIEKSLSHRLSHQEEENELRHNLQRIAKEQTSIKTKSKVISLQRYSKWLVAASIALLVGIFVVQNQTPIYSDYASHATMNISVRGSSNGTLEKVQDAFNTKDYALAYTHLSRLSEYYKDNTELQLFYAISMIETEQYDLAKIVLTKIADGDSLFKNEALWYLGLNALKQNDLETCKTYLEQIPQETEEYEKAKSLLRKL